MDSMFRSGGMRIIAAAAAVMCMMSACGKSTDAGTAPSTEETAVQAEEELFDESLYEDNTEMIPLEDLKIVSFFTFEEDDISAFSNRGDRDTTVLSVTDEFAKGGKKALAATGRTESWNGPALKLDGLCEPYEEYLISAAVMTREHSPVTMSLQYTDESGETIYTNLARRKGTDWLTFTQVKVSYSEGMKDVYIYFEGGTDDMFVDNLNVAKMPSANIENDLVSLSELFADDFRVGTAITPADMSSRGVMALTEKHFGASLTCGNEMKPDYVLDHDATIAYFEETGDDETPKVSFEKAKPVLDYARENNIPMRVHTLVWHSQTPTWFFKENWDMSGEWVSADKMTRRMENYIKAYFEELTSLYPDVDFYACDVVNEAWMEDGKPRKPGCREEEGEAASCWVQVYGDNSFIEKAFTYARKYAPEGCKLYYNDYNEYMDVKMNAIYTMAEDLKAKGLIDGIGMQSHLDVRGGTDPFPSVSMYNRALDKYSELGLDIQVTELDATVTAGTGTDLFEAQAEYYKGIVSAIYDHRENVSALIFWGITDDRSWRANGQPLLFDRTYKAKPAYYSIAEIVDNE